MKVHNSTLGTVQGELHLFKSLNNLYCYYSEFTDEETEIQGG